MDPAYVPSRVETSEDAIGLLIEPTGFTPDLPAQGVARVALSIVNAYLLGPEGAGDRGWVLVDAGLATSGAAIRAAAASRFGRRSRPSLILLTHGHFDHVGALRELADEWDVPIYAHPLEFPYLDGRSSYPPPDPAVGGGAMSFLSSFYPRGPIHVADRLRALPDNGSIPGLAGWRWLHTPGHTPGHVALYRDDDRTLIAGDAFVTTRQESAIAVLTRETAVRRPPAYYTTDWSAARRSVEHLAELRPEVAATGHGLPMQGEALRFGLASLVRDWETIAVPPQGRYVDEPALADLDGTLYVPSAVPDPNLPIVLGVAAIAVFGAFWLWSRSGSDELV